jgi:hypothetical protein
VPEKPILVYLVEKFPAFMEPEGPLHVDSVLSQLNPFHTPAPRLELSDV